MRVHRSIWPRVHDGGHRQPSVHQRSGRQHSDICANRDHQQRGKSECALSTGHTRADHEDHRYPGKPVLLYLQLKLELGTVTLPAVNSVSPQLTSMNALNYRTRHVGNGTTAFEG